MKDQNRSFALGAQEPVAIIGMSCTLPGGNTSPETFFEFLLKKKCGIVEVPSDRWNAEAFYDPDADAIGKSVSKWGGFIDDLRGFDAKFFGISPREANNMDPQQRLVLQGAVDAMMDAQIPIEEFSRQSTGVFIGVSQSEYRTVQEMRLTKNENYAGTGYALCINANRISHRLNLTGPSYSVDTACSSSMTALDQAVKNLRAGGCDMAIVGGVNTISHPTSFLAFSKAGMISPTGRISTFDAAANGFVRGEGVGMVVIKPLSRAQADGDRIHAVIEGSATNQDGATNTITAPNQQAQTAMLRSLFNSVDVRPDQIGFVEAHGTGTPIGDPIEAAAIGSVIGQNAPDHTVFVGSSKANIGHLESGAGIAGLIKAAMAVKTGIVPPNIRFKNPNPHIPFDALNIEVPVKAETFPQNSDVRYAVVNSFGFGGANASALVSSPPPVNYDHHPIVASKPSAKVELGKGGFPYVVPISGATQEAMQANAAALLKALGAKGTMAQCSLRDIASALATKRSHLMYRAALLVRDIDELKKALRKLAAGKTDAANITTGQKQPTSKLCFTFSGQGSQWWGMARDLLEQNPTFSDAVNAFDAEFQPVAGWSIRKELLKDKDATRIDDTAVTQPALFAIQSGLAALWKELGVVPDMVVGHSIGEAAASYVANGLSLQGAAKFLSKRGAIRDQLGVKGAMAAVGMNHVDVEALLPADGKLGIAAINGPGSTTISGDFDALHAFVEEFQMVRPDTFIRALTVDTAWHSYHLDAGESWFRREMASIDWSVPSLPFISTVTGHSETRFDTEYGWLNLRRPVRFQAGIETALDLGATCFVELGPAATLAGPTKSTALEAGATVSVLHSVNRKDDDFDAMAQVIGALFVHGYPLNWSAIAAPLTSFVDLPKNTWVKENFWSDSEESRDFLSATPMHPFLGASDRGNSTSWSSEINLRAYGYLKDHRMQSDVIFPAAGYIDMMIAMSRERFGPDKVIEVEDAIIHEALFISSDDDILFSSVFEPDRKRLKIYSRLRDSGDDWVLRSESTVRDYDVSAPPSRPLNLAAKTLKKIDIDYVYDVNADAGLVNYGPAFQTIKELRMSHTKTIAHVTLQDDLRRGAEFYHLHPTLFDGCLQILDPRMTLNHVAQGPQPGDPVCLPIGLGRMRVYADLPSEIIVQADQFPDGDGNDKPVGCTVYDTDGNVLVTIDDVRVKKLPSKKTEDDQGELPAHFVRQELVELREDPNTDVSKGRWVVLDADTPQDNARAKALIDLGADITRVNRETLGDDPGGALADLFGDDIEQGALAGVLVTWPLNLPQITEQTATDVMFPPLEACIKDLISLGELLDFARVGTNGLPDFVFLTTGAFPEIDGTATDPRILSQMPLVALIRGLATETPEYKVRVIDADTDALNDVPELARQVLTPSAETELILRAGKSLAPRLNHVAPADFDPKLLLITDADTTSNFHATMQSPGVIDHVGLSEIPLEPIGPDQVRVRVSAVGLNFRDVMAVTGLLPTEAEAKPAWQNLGLEFGGVVESTGDNVSTYKPGDRVMGLGKRCLQRFLTIDAMALTSVPDHISLAQASTIPSAFATAHHALNHVGRMRKGDKVFIHVATGGVGTAAVQLAQAAGAEVFATAGSPAKRRLLRERGVPHVMDSRSLKFADDVMQITNGTGVDILLNSLPGDFITKGLDIMAPYGRFLEIGKRDVYEDASIGMKALRRNVSLSVLDLAAMGEERPDLMAALFAELGEMLEHDVVSPLSLTEFPVSRTSDAIRYMSQAKHVGKVVVSLEEETFHVRRDIARPVTLSPTGSYLVTGGTAGFSLSVADWLSRKGAGHLILASRSGKIAETGEKALAKLQKRGTKVTIAALDITDEAAVEDFVTRAHNSGHPINGVLHGAAVIKDGFANQLSDDMISDVLSPKIKGAWNLHRAFAAAGTEPDFMIGFSSIAQVVGSAGQTNYIAGNAFLDAMAHYRHALNRPGTAIDWGVVGDAGFVARNAALASYLESVGQFGLTQADADQAIALAIAREAPTFVFSRADWTQVARANPALGTSPRFASVLRNDGGGTTEVRSRLLQLHGDALIDAAADYLKDEVTNVLKIDKSTIQVERPMSELGLDSLSSFELKIRIETVLDCSIPVSKFLQAPSIQDLSVMLGSEIESIRKAEATAMSASGDRGAETIATKIQGAPPASNQQLGLLRTALAPTTSDWAKSAMETCAQTTLSKPISVRDLEQALRKLERRHPMLTMRIDADGQIQDDGPGIELIEGPDDSRLNVAAGNLVRLSYADLDSAPMINIRLHKIAGDATSADVILHDLRNLLAGETLDKPMSKATLMGWLSAHRYDAEVPQAQQDRAFWWHSLAVSPSNNVPFATRSRALLPPLSGRNHGPADFILATLDGQPDQSALLVAFAAAVRGATNSSGPMIIGRQMSLRHSLPKGAAVGPFEIEQPLLVPEAHNCRIAQAQFGRMLDAANAHHSFDSHAAAQVFSDAFDDWSNTPFQILFEPLEALDNDAPKGMLHDLCLQVAPEKGNTQLRLIFDTDVVEKATAQKICDGIVAHAFVGETVQ
ncbi:MAG: SDR family NAD(P)-dependent oxidoreductase [Sulfitobacter sp.]